MDDDVRDELERGRPLIDMPTTGRHTGMPRRIETVYHRIGGPIYISGSPVAERTRAWLLNLDAEPRFTFHLKGRVVADLPATARIIADDAERRCDLRRDRQGLDQPGHRDHDPLRTAHRGHPGRRGRLIAS